MRQVCSFYSKILKQRRNKLKWKCCNCPFLSPKIATTCWTLPINPHLHLFTLTFKIAHKYKRHHYSGYSPKKFLAVQTEAVPARIPEALPFYLMKRFSRNRHRPTPFVTIFAYYFPLFTPGFLFGRLWSGRRESVLFTANKQTRYYFCSFVFPPAPNNKSRYEKFARRHRFRKSPGAVMNCKW